MCWQCALRPAAEKEQTTAKPSSTKTCAPCSTLSKRLSAELNLALVTGCCLALLVLCSRAGATASSASGMVSTLATDAAAACRGAALLHTFLDCVLALLGWLIAHRLLCRARWLERVQRQLTLVWKMVP